MDFLYWKKQIEASKAAHKDYNSKAKKCEKEFSDTEKNYNIFYSNVQTLDANLCINNPRPDIQRRFLKKLENNKLKSNIYSEVARVVGGAVEYVVDVSNIDDVMKQCVHSANVVGRGVIWVEYDPQIETDEEGQEYISERKINAEVLRYDEYLASTAEKSENVWWVARRHLLTAQDIETRFNIKVSTAELQFETQDETQEKRGEIWEIWDKNSKKRAFILLSDERKEMLEVQDDPYQLQQFFPCVELMWLREPKNLIPIPEFLIYEKQAKLLEIITKKTAEIEDAVKYIVLLNSTNKTDTMDIATAAHGSILTVPTADIGGDLRTAVGFYPVEPAINIINHFEQSKQEIKQNIYDITGISDIMRGVTDARETASAQLIKGVFGSLRFQDRQKRVHNIRKHIFKVIAEIICEHFDEDTLSEITCTYLPTKEEKLQAQMAIQQTEMMGQPLDPDMMDKVKSLLETPTWDDVLYIMKSDKLRNYTIDIETTSTAFDNQELITQNVHNFTNTYLNMARDASSLASPELVRGFLPLMKMNLNNIPISSSIIRPLEEAIEAAYKDMVNQSKQPQPDPAMMAEQSKIEIEKQKAQAETQKALIDQSIEQQKLAASIDRDNAELLIKRGELQIKQQEADRKDLEVEAQFALKKAEIETGVDINTNITGSVASFD